MDRWDDAVAVIVAAAAAAAAEGEEDVDDNSDGDLGADWAPIAWGFRNWAGMVADAAAAADGDGRDGEGGSGRGGAGDAAREGEDRGAGGAQPEAASAMS